MGKPRIIVFASGTKNSDSNRQGGSGFENLVAAASTGVLDADIVAVVSNYEHGSVRERAERLGIPFIYFDSSANIHSQILENLRIDGKKEVAEAYARIVKESDAKPAPKNGSAISGLAPWSRSDFTGWIALSGWYKRVKGLDPRRTFNIHPALLSFDGGRFGGKGMYRHHVHEAVKAALDAGEITESGFTMHFVTDEYDRGPAFFEYRVPLRPGMSTLEIEKTVNKAEHEWQPKITNMVVHEEIRWDGENTESLVVPQGYKYLPKFAEVLK